jgi:hypothetical protein
MRRFVAGLVCGAGALFAFRWRLRRRRGAEPAVEDPVEELKRKLEESRAAEPASESVPEPAPPPAAPAPAAELDERRREVHERGRASIDRMRPAAENDEAPPEPGV